MFVKMNERRGKEKESTTIAQNFEPVDCERTKYRCQEGSIKRGTIVRANFPTRD